MAEYEALFRFAAKVGALEGYLYGRRQVEPLYSWVGNIESMYHNLPDTLKKEINPELVRVLTRLLLYGGITLDTELKIRLNKMLLNIKIW